MSARTVALVQARMSSRRFPGKVLADLAGQPMIAFMFERLRRASSLDDVVLLTSDGADDEALVTWARSHAIPVVAGPLDDVLARFCIGAEHARADVIVRLTGDCPFIDPAIVDRVVALRAQTGADYASNVDPPGFADGLDVECFTRDALREADDQARDPREREHVTLWMRSADSSLARVNLRSWLPTDGLRLTVDYPDDLVVLREIAEELPGPAAEADIFDILRVLDRRDDLRSPDRHRRNEALNP